MTEVIRIDNLSFTYPDGHSALKGVSVNVRQGESVAIVGPNGAGKSTLLLHMNGILRSGNGVVKVMGKAVDEKNLRWVRGKVGLVFQDPDDQLFSPTVFDDVAFGPINMEYTETEVRRVVEESLGRVGMSGYEGRSSHHLSLGEKKRVALATVLAMSPEVMVLDEPTSNLDPGAKWSLIKMLKGLPVTRIVVSHDLDMVAAMCQRVVIFNGGRVIADGECKKILADRELLAANGLSEPIDEAS